MVCEGISAAVVGDDDQHGTAIEDRIRFDRGRHHRAKIGYVLLATEQTIEADVTRLAPPGVGVHFTRAPIPDSITVSSLTHMAPALGEAAALILPDGSLDVVCYACTSGSIVIGEERVFAELGRGAPGAKATSLVTGVIRALGYRPAKSGAGAIVLYAAPKRRRDRPRRSDGRTREQQATSPFAALTILKRDQS